MIRVVSCHFVDPLFLTGQETIHETHEIHEMSRIQRTTESKRTKKYREG